MIDVHNSTLYSASTLNISTELSTYYEGIAERVLNRHLDAGEVVNWRQATPSFERLRQMVEGVTKPTTLSPS